MTLIFAQIWIIAQGMEMAAQVLPVKLFWANIQYLPISLTSVTFLFMSMQFTGYDKWIVKRWHRSFFLIMPVIMNILIWTDGITGWLRHDVHLNTDGPFSTVEKTFSPFFYVFAAYNYVILLFTIFILISSLKGKLTIYRKQTVFLLVALILPFISIVLHNIGVDIYGVDSTPAVFGLCAIIIFYGIFRYKLFDVVPIAHSLIISSMKIGMIVLDQDGRLLDVNPAAKKILNIASDDVIGHSLESELNCCTEMLRIFREGKETVYEMDCQSDGRSCYYEISFMHVTGFDKAFIGWLIQIYDITGRKNTELIVKYAAQHDPLTGLPNRDYFKSLFDEKLNAVKANNGKLAVAYVDLDNYKNINDKYGHDVGDNVLSIVARRLQETLDEKAAVSRIGGDEYIAVLPGSGNDEDISLIGDKILGSLRETIRYEQVSLNITASVGFSIYPDDGDEYEVLIKKADQAMYNAKSNNKNSYCRYRNNIEQ